MKSPITIIKELFNNKSTKRPIKKSCYFCSKRTSDMRLYKNEHNQKIKVCHLCVEYAERRAYRKA